MLDTGSFRKIGYADCHKMVENINEMKHRFYLFQLRTLVLVKYITNVKMGLNSNWDY